MTAVLPVFIQVLQTLEKNHIPYMIVGSVASMVYGEPRMTHDMDLVVDLLPQHAKKIEILFPIEDFYCPPEEVIQSETVHRGQFNLIHQKSGIKIDLMVRKNSAHAIEEFSRKRKIEIIDGFSAYLATPEDIIIKKLLFYKEGQSEKHLKDIRGILAETTLDEAYLKRWIKDLNLENEYKKV